MLSPRRTLNELSSNVVDSTVQFEISRARTKLLRYNYAYFLIINRSQYINQTYALGFARAKHDVRRRTLG